jgi:hypothetical protein
VVLVGALASSLAPAIAAADGPALVAHAAPSGYCATVNAFAYIDGLNGADAACTLRPGAVILDAVYLQNASRVGGTALAAYPLVRLRVGVAKRLQFDVDAPSAIAQSHPGGGGSFPVTNPGYGITYALAQAQRTATALFADVLPPDWRFAAANAQARYAFGLTTNVAVTHQWTLGATASGTSSQRSGFGMVFPAIDASAGFAPNVNTQVQTDFGERIVTRHAVAQAFGDAAINQVLSKKVVLTVGVGTTFNTVNNSKAHYLASGFMYRP